jgi:hypothetical protein
MSGKTRTAPSFIGTAFHDAPRKMIVAHNSIHPITRITSGEGAVKKPKLHFSDVNSKYQSEAPPKIRRRAGSGQYGPLGCCCDPAINQGQDQHREDQTHDGKHNIQKGEPVRLAESESQKLTEAGVLKTQHDGDERPPDRHAEQEHPWSGRPSKECLSHHRRLGERLPR